MSNCIIIENIEKQQSKSENSKCHGVSTDNDASQVDSSIQGDIDIFDCSISAIETEQTSEISSEKAKHIQLPNIASFQSWVEKDEKKPTKCEHEEELLKTFITTRVCKHSKKIQKENKKVPKCYEVIDSNDKVIQILSKCGKLAKAHEILPEIKTNAPQELTKAQIKEQFNFDIDAQLVEGEDIQDDHLINVQMGEDFDLHQVGIKKHIPCTKKFVIYEYKSPKTRRIIRLLSCTHTDCSKVFRKWHNFFDHLRIHTCERPYKCTFPECNHTFTQKANLNKHMEIHQGKKRFTCEHCQRGFFTKFNLFSHLKTHKVEIKEKEEQQAKAAAESAKEPEKIIEQPQQQPVQQMQYIQQQPMPIRYIVQPQPIYMQQPIYQIRTIQPQQLVYIQQPIIVRPAANYKIIYPTQTQI